MTQQRASHGCARKLRTINNGQTTTSQPPTCVSNTTRTERHPDAPRHHRNTQLYVILNLKMTLICEACNWTFQTRYQYDKHLKLNHLEQQYRCYHCQKNFRTKKDRISHATIAYPNAPAKSFPPGVFPPGELWAPLKPNQIDTPTDVNKAINDIKTTRLSTPSETSEPEPPCKPLYPSFVYWRHVCNQVRAHTGPPTDVWIKQPQ